MSYAFHPGKTRQKGTAMSTKSSQTGYVRIWNNAPSRGVPREALLLLGLSTKRGDEATIGRFGSGIKFAPISALRKGYEFIVACYDIKGSYNFHMEEVKDSKYGEIEFVFNDGTRRASSYTIGAGEVSWDQDFQIIREAIANARDAVTENPGFNWGWEYADALDPDPTLFEVWITASEGVRKVMDSFEESFAFEKPQICSYLHRGLYDKEQITPVRGYAHGILVHEGTVPSLFDVENKNFVLSEERTLKHEWELADTVRICLTYTSNATVAKKLLEHVRDSKERIFELSEAVANRIWRGEHVEENSVWAKMMPFIFPEKTVFLDPNQGRYHGTLKAMGYNPIMVDESAKKILRSLGCPTAEEAIQEINDRNRVIDWDWMNYPILFEAMTRVTTVMPDLTDMITSLGVWDTEDKVLGVATEVNGKKTILITKKHADEGELTNIMATLVHECDHILTGIRDAGDEEGRLFRDIADNHIGELINRIYMMNNKEN